MVIPATAVFAGLATAITLDRFAQLPAEHQAEIREILRKKVESENLFSRFIQQTFIQFFIKYQRIKYVHQDMGYS